MGWDVGVRNKEGKSIVDFAIANDMVISNTFFSRSTDQYFPYKSQIDYVIYRWSDLKEVRNWLVIKEKNFVSQHRLVVPDSEIKWVKIKCWNLKDEPLSKQFKGKCIK